MDDCDIVAAIVAGGAAGIAYAYDKYAASLYGYCHWMAHEPAHAAVAVQDTFVIAAARLDGLHDPRKLRPWLCAVARNECHRWPRQPEAGPVEPADHGAADHGAADHGAAELRTLARAALAGLDPDAREVIELSLRYHLAGADLAAVLGVSRNQAHALAARARGKLGKSLGAPLAAHAGRQDCQVLAELLADWDGRLTALVRKRVSRHIEQCKACAERTRGELDRAALSGMALTAALPRALRGEVLRLCAECTPEVLAYREWVTQRAGQFGPAGFPQPLRPSRRMLAVTGAATATGVLIAVASTGIITVLALSAPHATRSLDAARASSGPASASTGVTRTAAATPAAGPTWAASATASATAFPVSSQSAVARGGPRPRATHTAPPTKAAPSPSPFPSAPATAPASPSPSATPGSPAPSPSPSPLPTRTQTLPPQPPPSTVMPSG